METDEHGNPLTSTRLTPVEDTRDCVILAQPTAVIPIIFLPGIMGTNLKNSEDKSVWRPPNTDGFLPILDAIGQMFAYWFRGPATRQRQLDPETTKPDDRGPIDTEGTVDEKIAKERGWGTVMRSAYHPAMSQMQRRLNNIMESCKSLEWWNDDALRQPAEYGDQKSNPGITEAELKQAAHYRFDVWGGGYNWLQSNRSSGQGIIDFIEETVFSHYRKNDQRAEKVILVTHSMGGFVTRALTEIHGYKNVLGIVYGVMPSTGAPATYHHCRCGYESISSVILGRNAAEVVAVMANSPGALELIPATDYADGKPWLKLGGNTGWNSSHALPINRDPYGEIYKNPAWYGLIPAYNEGLIDPAKIATPPADTDTDNEPLAVRDRFDVKIDDVAAFHADIARKYSSTVYIHYGADDRVGTWHEAHWKGHLETLEPLQTEDDGNGKLKLKHSHGLSSLEFAEAVGAGDGTVPTESSSAPDKESVDACFRHGNQGQGAYVLLNSKGKDEGYTHQDSYNDVRSQWAALYGIIKIAQRADWAT